MVAGDWRLSDALVPVVMLALFPFFEWVVHVFVLIGARKQSAD